MDEKNFLFEWRDAIKGEDGPDSNMRFILGFMSFHMDLNGNSCFPSQRTLSRETGLSLKTINKYLQLAEKQGWIIRVERKTGKFNRGHIYTPLIPDMMLTHVQHQKDDMMLKQVKHQLSLDVHPEDVDVHPEGSLMLTHVQQSPSVSTSKSSSADAPAVLKTKARAGGNGTDRAVSGQSAQTPPMLRNLPSIKADETTGEIKIRRTVPGKTVTVVKIPGETTNVVSIPAYLKHKQGRPDFLKEEIAEGSVPKVRADIQDLADKLYQEKKWLKVYIFVQQILQNKCNPRAVLHALNQAYSKQEIGNYWAYCEKIVRVEGPNYNAQDYGKANNFRASNDDKPMYWHVDDVMGPEEEEDFNVSIQDAQQRLGKIANSIRGF